MSTDTDVPQFRDHQIEAMEHLFAFCDAVHNGNLTGSELTEIILAAVEEGHEMMQICVVMAQFALREALRRKREPSNA